MKDIVDNLRVRCSRSVEDSEPEQSSTYIRLANRHVVKRRKTEASACSWLGKFSELENHRTKDCEFAEVMCSHKGCSVKLLRRDQGEHETCCEHRPVQCEHCNKTMERREVALHKRWTCDRVIEECHNECGQLMERRLIAHHKHSVCPREPIACDFEHMGCPAVLLRQDYASHQVIAAAMHATLVRDPLPKKPRSVSCDSFCASDSQLKSSLISKLQEALVKAEARASSAEARASSAEDTARAFEAKAQLAEDAAESGEDSTYVEELEESLEALKEHIEAREKEFDDSAKIVQEHKKFKFDPAVLESSLAGGEAPFPAACLIWEEWDKHPSAGCGICHGSLERMFGSVLARARRICSACIAAISAAGWDMRIGKAAVLEWARSNLCGPAALLECGRVLNVMCRSVALSETQFQSLLQRVGPGTQAATLAHEILNADGGPILLARQASRLIAKLGPDIADVCLITCVACVVDKWQLTGVQRAPRACRSVCTAPRFRQPIIDQGVLLKWLIDTSKKLPLDAIRVGQDRLSDLLQELLQEALSARLRRAKFQALFGLPGASPCNMPSLGLSIHIHIHAHIHMHI